MNNLNDYELVEEAKNGNENAFNIIVSRYRTRIQKTIYNYVKDTETAKDLTQETFFNAYKAIGKFRGDSKLYTWLYSIAKNASMNYLTANNKRKKIFTSLDETDYDDYEHGHRFPKITRYIDNLTPESQVICDEMVANINKTIDKLNNNMKKTFLLRYEDDMSYENIAKELKIPLGTAKSRVSKVREQINNNLGIEYDRRRNKNSKKK